MQSVLEMVVSLGGMAQKQQLVALGASDYDLTIAVRSGSVRRARQGWYTAGDESEAPVRAVRVGGRLTGLSAIVEWGGWVEVPPPLHVSMRPGASRMRSQWNRRKPLLPTRAGIRLHWDDVTIANRGTSTSVALEDALVRVVLDEPLEVAVAALDWALRTGRLSTVEF